jgi:uncharacterized membrane protein (GlpM family)
MYSSEHRHTAEFQFTREGEPAVHNIKWVLYFIGGGLLMTLVPFIGSHYSPRIAGLIMLFPLVTLVSLSFLGIESGRDAVVAGTGSAIKSLPTVLSFLIAVYVASSNGFPLTGSILIGILAWLVTAFLLTLIPHWLSLK